MTIVRLPSWREVFDGPWALRTSDRTGLRVIFQARELPLETEAVLAEFGVVEIAAR